MKNWFVKQKTIEAYWYSFHFSRRLLIPLAWIYQLITSIRRYYLASFCQKHSAVPIIVVGNITVGGVGKTPLVIALVQQLQARGVRVGIVSRGYKSTIDDFPHEVTQYDTAYSVGDEPFLLYKKTAVPVVISPKRMQAVDYLLRHHSVQIIISDDGLQHYRMGRAIEIVVIDGVRGLGNGLCLPAGPLRESSKRLKQVDFIIINGGLSASYQPSKTWSCVYPMMLNPGQLTGVLNGLPIDSALLSLQFAAVAGIGHPERFFATLRSLNVSFNPYPFPDHYCFRQCDLLLSEPYIVMTEKDAVKCFPFATSNMYFLPVNAVVCEEFWTALWSHKQLQGCV